MNNYSGNKKAISTLLAIFTLTIPAWAQLEEKWRYTAPADHQIFLVAVTPRASLITIRVFGEQGTNRFVWIDPEGDVIYTSPPSPVGHGDWWKARVASISESRLVLVYPQERMVVTIVRTAEGVVENTSPFPLEAVEIPPIDPIEWRMKTGAYAFTTNTRNGTLIVYDVHRPEPSTAPALVVETVNGISGTNFVMRWDSVAGACYQVQCSSDLSSWLDVGVPISGTGAAMSWGAAAIDADGKFYRVVSS